MPIQIALKLADAMANAFGRLDRKLAVEDLIRIARRRTGEDDFGSVDFGEPLLRFLDSCADDASLSLVGRYATRWDVVRFLSNLLLLQAAERDEPGILAERIEQPIFITGLPRSGTTFLHRMMLADPENRAPLVYQTIYPLPSAGSPQDRRPHKVARQLRAFGRLAPEFHALHPLEATSPQECSEITAHVFRSLRFDSNYRIPSYRAWLEADPVGHVPAYEFHRRFLQHLQHQAAATGRPARWVVKCPDHLFALEAIKQVYPDARLIFVHRDPVKVLLSVTRLTEVLRRPFTRQVDPMEIGREESARWHDGTTRMMQVGDDAGLPDPVCHVHHLDLVSDPISTVEQIYGHFGLTLPSGAAKSMEHYVAAQPTGGYGAHSYSFEDHGLDAAAEQERFRPYMLHFGVAPETLPSRRKTATAPVTAAASGG